MSRFASAIWKRSTSRVVTGPNFSMAVVMTSCRSAITLSTARNDAGAAIPTSRTPPNQIPSRKTARRLDRLETVELMRSPDSEDWLF